MRAGWVTARPVNRALTMFRLLTESCPFFGTLPPFRAQARNLGPPIVRPYFFVAALTRWRAMTEMTKPLAVVLLSGGLDSMVCAALAREAGFGVLALTIDYHQRHRVELEAARRIASQLADRHIVLPIDLSAFGGSALTSDIAVPK